MRKSLTAALVMVASLTASAPAMANSGNSGPSAMAASYDAYYDDFYGPFYNGYWTEQKVYYYSTGPSRPYVRDDDHHFRHVMISGYHPVEGFGPELRAEQVALTLNR